MTNDKGFNDFGFKDVELPVSLRQIGNKRLKISQYCPKANKKSTSEAEDVYTSLNISSKIGETWQNVSFSFDELELLNLRIPRIMDALSSVGGAIDGSKREGKGEE